MASQKKAKAVRAKVQKVQPNAYLDMHLDRLRTIRATLALEVAMLEKALGVEPVADAIHENGCIVCANDRGKSVGFCADCQTDFNQTRRACKDDYWTMLSWAAARARRYALHQHGG